MRDFAVATARRSTLAGHTAARRPFAVVGVGVRVVTNGTRLWALTALAIVAAGAALVAVLAVSTAAVRHEAPAFLARSLGPEAPAASLARVSASGISTSITPVGLSFRNQGARLTLASQDVVQGSGSPVPWSKRANGAFRETSFGNEAIIFQNGQIEQLLTVGKRVGKKTWSWRIASNAGYPRVGDDGYVAFIKDHAIRQDIVIKPVAIFDVQGRDVTPAGLRWQIAQDGRGYLLQLTLNDKGLAVPYVIDPIVFTARPRLRPRPMSRSACRLR